MKALHKFRLTAYLLSALHHWSFAIRHSSFVSDVGPRSQNVSDAGIGPENA